MSTSNQPDTDNNTRISVVLNNSKMTTRRIRCMKTFLTFFNIHCLLFGFALSTACVIRMRDKISQSTPPSAISHGVLSFLVTLGVSLMIAAVVGCIGALKENVKTLYLFAGFFIGLLLVELLVGVGAAVLSAWVGGSSELRVQFYRNTTTVDDESTNYETFWNKLQSENKCCGVDGPQDYEILHRDIPVSCCARAYPLREGNARRHLHATCLSEQLYYMCGCEEVLRRKQAVKGNIFMATGIIFASIEILCVVLAIWMARTVYSERRRLQATLQAHFET